MTGGNHSAQPSAASRLHSRLGRIIDNWVYGGTLAGLVLLGLYPTLTSGWPLVDRLVFLSLPIYMIHQYEEHDADRFRHFVNDMLAGGREAMTRQAVFVINVFGVWLPIACCIILVRSDHAGGGLFAGWLLLVNALLHVLPAARTRQYNPGLVTAVLLFLPLGAAILLTSWSVASLAQYGAGLALAIALHAVIMIHMKLRLSRL